jgi:hypothetical protein
MEKNNVFTFTLQADFFQSLSCIFDTHTLASLQQFLDHLKFFMYEFILLPPKLGEKNVMLNISMMLLPDVFPQVTSTHLYNIRILAFFSYPKGVYLLQHL